MDTRHNTGERNENDSMSEVLVTKTNYAMVYNAVDEDNSFMTSCVIVKMQSS